MSRLGTAKGPIDVRERTTSGDGRGLKVETDVQVPGTVLGRWVFHAPRDSPWSTERPHVHDYPHDFMCLRGRCVVEFTSETQQRRSQVLRPGESVHVPEMVAHRLFLEAAAVVASYIPHRTWLRRPDVVTLETERRHG